MAKKKAAKKAATKAAAVEPPKQLPKVKLADLLNALSVTEAQHEKIVKLVTTNLRYNADIEMAYQQAAAIVKKVLTPAQLAGVATLVAKGFVQLVSTGKSNVEHNGIELV